MTKEQFLNLRVGDTLFSRGSGLLIEEDLITHVIKDDFGFCKVFFTVNDRLQELEAYRLDDYFVSRLEAIRNAICYANEFRKTKWYLLNNNEEAKVLFKERLLQLEAQLAEETEQEANNE